MINSRNLEKTQGILGKTQGMFTKSQGILQITQSFANLELEIVAEKRPKKSLVIESEFKPIQTSIFQPLFINSSNFPILILPETID